MNDREVILAVLDGAGLSHLAAKVEALMKHAVFVTPTRVGDGDKLARGASRFGGHPDLPPGIDWPTAWDVPMQFVAQIRLSDVAPHDIDGESASTAISDDDWRYHQGMRIVCVVLLAALWSGCGDDDDDAVGDGAVRDGAVSFMDARVMCTGTHAPCDRYSGNPQSCVNHGCSVSGSRCIGTPHTCESFGNSLHCGQGHGCNACAYCGTGTTCVQTCIGPYLSVITECKPSTQSCNVCSEACALALCPANSFGTDAGILSCMATCEAPTPGAFQCQR